MISNWKVTGVTGFNLAIKTVNGGWLEYKAAELGTYGPLLAFKYTVPDDTTHYSYSQRPVKDSYRITGTQAALAGNTWKLKNLLPQRMFFRFNLPNNIFVDQNGNTISDLDRKRMTINKAELVLFVKNNPYYNSKVCYFYPYRVKPDTIALPQVLSDSDLEVMPLTYSSGRIVNVDSIKIEITPSIQAFTSGDRANNGVVVKCTSEMLNFGNLEFWHYSNAPAGKKPYIKIQYTTPFLKGE